MSAELNNDLAKGVRLLQINRPERRNALTLGLVDQLSDAFEAAASDPQTACVILTGSGGSFSSGLDLKAVAADASVLANDPEQAFERFHRLIRAIRACSKPVIALVDGAAFGFGCDLALSCDLRVATERAYFQDGFVRIGLVPDGGGSYWLPRLVGLARAAEMLMLGERIEAAEAARIGLVNRCVPVDEASEVAHEMAARLVAGPPAALARIKKLIAQGAEGSLQSALAAEKQEQLKCLKGPEFAEGVAAFMQKREPNFQG